MSMACTDRNVDRGMRALTQCVRLDESHLHEAGASFKPEAVSTQTGGGAFRVSWIEADNCMRYSVIGAHLKLLARNGWQTIQADDMVAPSTAANAEIDLA